MPIYTFKCQLCGNTFDKLTYQYDIDKTECNCDKNAIAEKIFASTSPPVFKGSGFYETDYRKSSS